MTQAFVLLLATALPSTARFYGIGLLFVKRLSLTGFTEVVGFLIAWGGAAICALLLAKQFTVVSAQESMILASFISSVAAIVCIAFAGGRKPKKDVPPKVEEK